MISYLTPLGIFKWLDFFEIALLTTVIYRFCLWLKRDRSSFLLGYFYLGCFGFIVAALLDLHALLLFYAYCWPALVLLFVIVHQKNLQQSYVAARTIQPINASADTSWVHLLMRAAFKALQRKKNIVFIIEGTHVLDDYLTKPLIIQSPVQQQLVDMIMDSTVIDDQSIILVNQRGVLCALNCQWIMPNDAQAADVTPIETKIYTAQWTKNTDALAFFAQADSKRVTVIAQGTIVPDLASDKAELIIGQFIRKQKFINRETSKPATTQQRV